MTCQGISAGTPIFYPLGHYLGFRALFLAFTLILTVQQPIWPCEAIHKYKYDTAQMQIQLSTNPRVTLMAENAAWNKQADSASLWRHWDNYCVAGTLPLCCISLPPILYLC